MLVRKIGSPWQPELALGAVVDGGDPQVLINEAWSASSPVARSYITSETARQLSGSSDAEGLSRRQAAAGRFPAGRSSSSMTGSPPAAPRARAPRRQKGRSRKDRPRRPGCPEDTIEQLRAEVDDIVCLSSPSPFIAVGAHYGEFPSSPTPTSSRCWRPSNSASQRLTPITGPV